jgi:hypothetical protein
MPRLPLLLLLLAARLATAGELFPLTNTRYDVGGGSSLLRTDGTQPVVFWNGRVTHVIDGQNRLGSPLFQTADAVWTGTRFLAVSEDRSLTTRILGRFVDRDGHPEGSPFVILENAEAPRLVVGHGRVLMVYHAGEHTRAMVLGADGRPALTNTVITQYYRPAAVAATAEGFAVHHVEEKALRLTRLDPAGQIISAVTLPRSTWVYGVGIASGPSRVLLMWMTEDRRLEAAIADSQGNIGTPMLIESDPASIAWTPSAVWNGTGWTVAYDRSTAGARVVTLDALATRIITTEQLPAGDVHPSVAMINGKPAMTWSRGFSPLRGPVWMSELPLAGNTARVVSFAATEQSLLATTSSENATLAVWREAASNTHTLRAGRRTDDGQWTEHSLGAIITGPVVAASDGRNFVVFVGSEAIFLDEETRPTGVRVTLPIQPEAVAWNGRHYAAVDTNGNATLLNANGELSALIDLDIPFGVTHLASDGEGFLVTGGTVGCQFLLCFVTDSRAARLDATLQRRGAAIPIDPDRQPSAVVWTGSQYVVISQGAGGTTFTRIGSDSDATQTHSVPQMTTVRDVIAVDGEVAVVSIPTMRSALVQWFSVIGELRRSENVAEDFNAGFPFIGLERASDDRLTYLSTPMWYGPPHDSMRRVAAAIVGDDLPAAPPSPFTSVRDDGSRFVVEWSAPAGTVNGYRVEYRIDDGAWIELERWFGPGEQTVSVRRPSFGTTFAFRVRAFNDAGVGPYSVSARKRRAAR